MGYTLATVVIATCLVWSPVVHSLNITKNTPIKLNVGGHYFITTVETLRESKKLKSMFEDKMNLPPKDDEGRYFIDHDGEMFKYILRYLRTGNLTFPANFVEGEVLEKAAAFYQIDRLQAALKSGVGKADVLLYLVINQCNDQDEINHMSLQISQGSVTWQDIFQKFESELLSNIDYQSNTSLGVQWRPDYDVSNVPFNKAVRKIGSQDFFLKSCDLNLKFKLLKILLKEGFFFIKDTDDNSAAKERSIHLGLIYSTLETYLLKRIRPLTD